MKRISNWTILGYILGFGFSLFSGIRYFVIYPDEDKAIVYVMIGLIICGLAWLYSKTQNMSNDINAMEEYLADKK